MTRSPKAHTIGAVRSHHHLFAPRGMRVFATMRGLALSCFWTLLFGIVLGMSMLGCDCAAFAPSAETEHTAGDHEVEIRAQGFRSFGIDGAGGHGFGLLWPTREGGGVRMEAQVDARPEVVFDIIHVRATPTSEQVDAFAQVEVAASPDGRHIQVQRGTRRVVLHLLPVGPPFVTPSSRSDAPIDLTTLPTPEAIATAEVVRLAGERSADEAPVWQALHAQPHGEMWDRIVLAGWPTSAVSHTYLVGRFTESPPLSQAVRAEIIAQGRVHLAGRPSSNAVALLVMLGDAGIAALDESIAARWAELDAPLGRVVLDYVRQRIRVSDPAVGPVAMAEPARSTAVRGSLALLRRATESARVEVRARLASQWIGSQGTPEEIAERDRLLLDGWAEGSVSLRIAVLEIVRNGQASEAFRTRARRVVADALERNRDIERASAIQLAAALDPDAPFDEHLDRLLVEWTPSDHGALLSLSRRGSPGWRLRARTEVDRRLALGDEIPTFGDSDSAARARNRCAHFVIHLEADLSCDAIEAYRSALTFSDRREHPLPERCRPASEQ